MHIMASTLPLPIPPRTPTPPVEPELDRQVPIHDADSQATMFDSDALSPMSENFPVRYANLPSSISAISGGGGPLSPTSPNSLYSLGSIDSAGSQLGSKADYAPFKFKTTTLAKSPVSKSVRDVPGPPSEQKAHPLPPPPPRLNRIR